MFPFHIFPSQKNSLVQTRSCARTRLSLIPIIAGCTMVIMAVACSQKNVDQSPATSPNPTMPHFSDITSQAGIDFTQSAFHWGLSPDPVAMMGGGVCWLDYDQDGWLDLFAVNSYSLDEAGRWDSEGGIPGSALFHNRRGEFENVSQKAGVDFPIRGNGCVAGDLNGDGYPDLYITTERVNVLLWNNQDGTFTDGSVEAGVDAYGWQTSAVIGDLNGDSLPDLFVAGYVDTNNQKPGSSQGFPRSHLGRRDLLFLNNGVGQDGYATFKEVGLSVGLENKDFEYGLGAIMSDFDEDGDLDIFVANDTNPNRLYENITFPGGIDADPLHLGFRLVEVGQFANIGDQNSGMGVASSDYNNDGMMDLMVTNMGPQLHSVYTNSSKPDQMDFQNSAKQIGVDQIGVGWTGWGVCWADIDLDTDLDLIIANGGIPVLDPPNDVQRIQFFSNLSAQGLNGLFQDLTSVAGFNNIEPMLARGSAVADFDNDGDLDVAVNSIGGRLVLLRNDQQGGNWLAVELDRFAPGTKVSATLPDGTDMLCETHAGSSYLSSEDPRCHFGLGSATEVAEVRVDWPDGTTTTFQNVPGNKLLKVSQQEGTSPAGDQNFSASAISSEDFSFELLLMRGGAKPLEILPQASSAMIKLGEDLFWDRILSGSKDVSCATCHHPLEATGDGLSLSIGVKGNGLGPNRMLGENRPFIPRNAPDLFNRGADGWVTMFWDARVSGSRDLGFNSPAGEKLPDDLDNIMAVQAMFPVTSRDEMRGQPGDLDVFGQQNEMATYNEDNFPAIWDGLMDRLLAIPEYRDLFQKAYPGVNLDWMGFQHAANAIAAYQMATFTYSDSPWDRYLAGENDALTPEGRRGAELFYGEAGCSRCHNGPLLTDQQFYNIGVPQLGPGKASEAPLDIGRGHISNLPADAFTFRTPPLRNVSLTGPWMHNGAYTSLENAVRHHLNAVDAYSHYDISQVDPQLAPSYLPTAGVMQTLNPRILKPLQLTDLEFQDLMAFLSELTSPSSEDVCGLIPSSVPSGLEIDNDPEAPCHLSTP